MIPLPTSVSNIVIIGCGGTASWLVPPLMRFLQLCDHIPNLVFVDGDTIEERNLDRQWFSQDDIGTNKAEALAMAHIVDHVQFHVVQQYYTDGTILPVQGMSLFICCADNHAARRAVLAAVDRSEGWAIIAGNEYTEAEAYFYQRSMQDTPADPRQYYPALLTDNTGDPTRPAGCTGLAALADPQLIFANFSAANHVLWLFYHHFVEKPAQGRDYLPQYMPVRTWNLGTNYRTTKLIELEKSYGNTTDTSSSATTSNTPA